MKRESRKTAAFRMTPQRAEILRFLDGNKSHPSAEDIYARLKRKFPGMSFATVYNTLQTLLARRQIAEIKIDPARKRFDPGLTPHSHLFCVRCCLITDLPAGRLAPPKNLPKGFKILSCNIEYYGICPACGRGGNKGEISCAKKKQT
ncbi:MAG TPA: transcriptional repressor [Elusimicrobia bacterium]|nr:transcriptional repressor [Elusimicrobiota bacterium]